MSSSVFSETNGGLPTAAAPTSQVLVLGGGCFWCTEAVFLCLRGVLAVESGYANGDSARWPKPSYEAVCGGETGYNEVVQVRYDPAQVSTRALLEVFFATHDPTTVNRQGNDVGTQYRSAIYTTTPEQQADALAVRAQVQAAWGATPIVTEIEPLRHYHPAEAYHQNYFARHPQQGYCAWVVAPKVQKLQRDFAERLKEKD